LIVLGMHRSGTSALTRIFSLLGADLPKNLMPPAPTNQTGHWESQDLMTIHDQVLASGGSTWDDWRAFNPDWFNSPLAGHFKKKILDVLRNDFASSQLFVIKDPRICRLWPLWRDVLEEFGAKPLIVMPIRNPLEVAASLKERNEIIPAKAHLFWLRHVLDAESATRGLPRAITSFESLIEDWKSVIGTVASRLGLSWPRRGAMVEIEVEQFLSTQFKHYTINPERLFGNAEVMDWLKEAYATLANMAKKFERRASMARLDKIRAAFDKASAAFGVAVAMSEMELGKREAAVLQLSHDLSDLRDTAAEREREQQQAAASLAADLEAARAAARDREVAVTEGERRIAELSEQHAAIRVAVEDLNRERGQLATVLEEEKEAAARNNAQADLFKQELEALRSTVREHETSAAKLRADLQNAQSLLNDRKTELDKLSRELMSAQSTMRDRDAQIDRLGRDADATRLFLRESQSEVQRLAGEVDTARVEMERANAERQRVSDAFAIKSSELNLTHGRMELLQKELEELRVNAAELPIMRKEIVALKAALEESRREADRRELQIKELSRELQSAATQADRIRDLEGRISATNAEKGRLADELKRTGAEIRRVESSAAERAAALEAVHVAALAESENKAQVKIRSLRDQLVDAEATLAKAKNDKRNGPAWLRLVSSARRRAERQLVTSGLFDAEWYKREYPNAAESARSPAAHYLEEGYLHGYRPNPLFDTRWYLEHYEDVRSAGVNPLVHYLENGCKEGRDPGPEFETDFYLTTYPDVRMSGMNPLSHYLLHGRYEGRLPMKPRGGD
jgi:hypothetical protein